MSDVRRLYAAALAAVGVALAPGVAAAQISLHGRAEIGRLEHRIRLAGLLEPSSGTLLGGALGVVVGERFEAWGEAMGGHLVADSPAGEDRDVAEVQLLGGMHVRPWVTLQSGVSVRTYSTPLARQRWTTLRLGAEGRLPLAIGGLQGIVRAQWMPVVSVSGVARPDVALTTGAGLEWRGKRVSLSAVYTLERYDFPASDPSLRRLEEVSALRVRATIVRRATGRI
ncbi:MAG TPA: hypothetical protein VGQ06_12280 [Gemmatimonadales bacterium]|nr:hypothetical protein [Gemmatimonadales bacterium]